MKSILLVALAVPMMSLSSTAQAPSSSQANWDSWMRMRINPKVAASKLSAEQCRANVRRWYADQDDFYKLLNKTPEDAQPGLALQTPESSLPVQELYSRLAVVGACQIKVKLDSLGSLQSKWDWRFSTSALNQAYQAELRSRMETVIGAHNLWSELETTGH